MHECFSMRTNTPKITYCFEYKITKTTDYIEQLHRFESVIQHHSLEFYGKCWDYRWEVDRLNGDEPLTFSLIVVPRDPDAVQKNQKVLTIEKQHLTESNGEFRQRMEQAKFELRCLPLHSKTVDSQMESAS